MNPGVRFVWILALALLCGAATLGAAELRIVGAPTPLPDGGWRITWSSEPGRTYALLRQTGGGLTPRAAVPWVVLTTVEASGTVAQADDPAPDPVSRFYQVAQLHLTPGGTGPIQFLEAPRYGVAGWEFTWTSAPGQTYVLQYWTGADLSRPGSPVWSDVATVVATGSSSTAIDTTSGAAPRRFYRIVGFPSGSRALVFSSPTATPMPASQPSQLQLTVEVLEGNPAGAVVFLEGTNLLGPAALEGGARWTLSIPFTFQPGARGRYYARATDAAGDPVVSDLLDFIWNATNRFAALDAAGFPTGVLLVPDAQGVLPPFEYRPGTAAGAASTDGLALRFPEGARLVRVGGKELLEFQDARATLPPASALQFRSSDPGAPDELTVHHASPVRLPAEALTAEALAAAFGFDPADGVPVSFFGQVPARWTAGTLMGSTVRGARFRLEGLPLPAVSGDYPGFQIPLDARGEIALPFHGEFALPDGSSNPPRLHTGPRDPAWVTVRADGTIGYRNRSEVTLPSGAKFRADIHLDSPTYRIQIFAESVHVPMIESLADLLPSAPETCIPASIDPAALGLADRCLDAFDRALHSFSASAVAAAPVTALLEGASLDAPPEDVDTTVAVLEGWTYSGLAAGAFALPLDDLRDLVTQTGDSAAAATDLETTSRHRLALARAQRAAELGALSGSASASADLDAALAEAEAAVLDRARSSDALVSLDALRSTVAILLETRQVFQESGRSESVALREALALLLEEFLRVHVRSLGVEAGAFTPAGNPTVAGMNRFVVFQTLHDLVDLLANAQVLEIDTAFAAPVDEAMSQMALRLFGLVGVALDAAEAGDDVPGFLFAFEDLLELVAMRQLAIFPDVPALDGLPDSSDLPAYADRLNALVAADLLRPYPERSLMDEAAQVRRLLRVLQQMPEGVSLAAGPFQRAFDRMTELLAVEMNRLPGLTSLTELMGLLEAGILHERMRRRFDLPASGDWESDRLPGVIARIAAVGESAQRWSELHRAFARVQVEARQLGAESEPVRQRLYLQQAVPLLEAARAVAVALWQSEASRRETDPLAGLVDLALPGDIHIDHVAGALALHLKTGALRGSFKGRMRLPKFAADLQVTGASFRSAGEFALTAHGTAGFPIPDPVHALTVPARHPLQLRFRAPNDLRVSGGLDLTLQNGLRFGGFFGWEDPLYTLGLHADGLRLDLADKLVLYRPVLSPSGSFTREVAAALNEGFRGLGAVLDPLAATLEPMDLPGPGRPPEFVEPRPITDADPVVAWANALLAETALGVNRSYAGSFAVVRAAAGVLGDQLGTLRAALTNVLGDLDARARTIELTREATRALNDVDAAVRRRVAAGDPVPLSEVGQSPEVRRLLDETRGNTEALLEAPSSTADPRRMAEVLRLALEVAAVHQEYDVPSGIEGRLAGFVAAGESRFLLELGFDPATGELTNAAPLEARSAVALNQLAVDLLNLEADRALSGDSTRHPGMQSALNTLTLRTRERALTELAATPAEEWEQRLRLIELLDGLNAGVAAEQVEWPVNVPQLDLTTGPHNPTAETEALMVELEEVHRVRERDLRARAEALHDPLRALLLVLRAKTGRAIAADVRDALRDRTAASLAWLQEQAGEPWPRERLRDGLALVDLLLALADDVERLEMNAELIQVRDVTLPALTARCAEVAELQHAWWVVADFTQRLLEAGERRAAQGLTALDAALGDAASGSVRAADRITQALLALRPGFAPVDLQLPGDLVVRRAYGTLRYHRDTGVLGGGFGGRIEFPGVSDAFFDISHAAVATDGSIDIAAATGGPIPFGPSRLTSTLALTAGATGLLGISGTGQLLVPLNTTTQIFNVALGYDATRQQLSFDTAGDALDWRLTDDVVLLSGGLGFDVSPLVPSGVLRFSGSAGLFAREKPLPTVLGRTNFFLIVTNTAVRLELAETHVSFGLTNGTLVLPEYLRASLSATNPVLTTYLGSPAGAGSPLTAYVNTSATNPPPGTSGPAISLSPTNPVTLTVSFDPPAVAASGELQFRDLGFAVPGFESIEVAIAYARLVFPTNQLPGLTNVYGALQFPLPGQTNIVEVLDGAWSLDGYPTGTLRLRTDLDVFDVDGWRLTLLGATSPSCPTGTGLTVRRQTNGSPLLRLDTGIQFTVPDNVFTDESGDGLSVASCGSLLVPVSLTPELLVDGLALSNRLLRLGGDDGVVLTNVVLRADGLTHLFNPTPANPFRTALTGTLLLSSGAGLGLSNAVFHFEGDLLPRFTVSELSVIQPGALFELAESMPMTLEEGRVRFLNDAAPIPALFALTNLAVTLSGTVALPPVGEPVLGGRVKDLMVTFLPTGVPQFSVDALGITVDLTALIGEDLPLNLGGTLYVGGLNDPPNFLFSGKLQGNFKGNAVEGLIAVDPCGIRGLCFGLAGAETAIQIAYGFVLTGAKGGVSFVSSNADPCDFLTYLPIDPVTGKPLGGSSCRIQVPTNCPPAFTLEDLARPPASGGAALGNPSAFGGTTVQSVPPPLDFPCPGDCPPASVNILCQPHPHHQLAGSPHTNRVILKFTAIDEPTLNALGITPELVAAFVPDFAVNKPAIALELAALLRAWVDGETPRPPTNAPPEILALEADLLRTLDEIELAFANRILCTIDPFPASSRDLAALLYHAVRDTAWAGVPCPDTTIKLEGSVSYTGLSAFANVSGGVVISTTGSAGVLGAVNVFGIPVGRARVFVNQTDANGNPMLPSICGEVVAAIGPLELGTLALLEDCPDCTVALFNSFAGLAGRLTDAYVFGVLSERLPALADPGLNASQHFARLDTPERQMIFLGAMLQAPPRDSDGQVAAAFLDFVVELADAVQPRWSMCGEVTPRLFGFPLSGGGTLYSYQFYAGPNLVDGVRQGYLLRDDWGFSPFQMFAYYAGAVFTSGLSGLFAPAIDEAHVSTTFTLPTFGQIVRDSFTRPAPEFVADRVEDFLDSARLTVNYRLAPLGMELGRAGGRILFPSLEHHPRGPSPRTPPHLRDPDLPDRLAVLLAALGDKDNPDAVNRLADSTWRGEGDADFGPLFAGSEYASTVVGKGLSLRDDYFPHGGILGAGTLDFPLLLSRPMPPSLGVLLDSSQAPIDRLAAASDFLFNHVLATERVGELGFYIPAPNPPLATFPTTAQELLESLRQFVPDDPLQVTNYYPIDQGFLSGWLDAPVLGLPTVRAKATWLPADGLLRLDTAVPTNSWVYRLLGVAPVTFEVRGNTNQFDTIDHLFRPVASQVDALDPASPALSAALNAIAAALPQQLANGLPKIAARLEVAELRIPVPTYSPTSVLPAALTVAAIRDASFEAYSPYYRQAGATGSGPLDRARRDGGVAVTGTLDFLNGALVIPSAEFAVIPDLNALGLPTIAGRFQLSAPDLLGFRLGALTASQRAQLGVASSLPLVDFLSGAQQVRLLAFGSLPTVTLGPLFTLKPTSGSPLGVSVQFETSTSALPSGALSLGPARLESTLFPQLPALLVHGKTTNDPFSVSTTGPWSTGVTLPAGEPLDLAFGGTTVVRLSRPSGAASQPFRAVLSGDGTRSATLEFTNLDLGVVIETFPDERSGDPRRRSFTLGSGATVSCSVSSSGAVSLRATIPTSTALGGTPLSTLQGGFELQLDNDRLRFTGTAQGGLWQQLGGGPLALSVTATRTGLQFSASARLPVLNWGVFELYEVFGLNRLGPLVTVSQSGIALGNNLRLQVHSSLVNLVTVPLPPFSMNWNGSFDVGATQALGWEGASLGTANAHLRRTGTGPVTFTAEGAFSPVSLTGFGSIEPITGSQLGVTATLGSDGTGSLVMDAARLRLSGLGIGDALVHGAGDTNAPFSFSRQGPWSAQVTCLEFVGDPPDVGGIFPEFLRLSAPGGGALCSGAISGDGGTLLSFTATRTNAVNLTVLKGSPMERSWNNVSVGTATWALTNVPRQLVVTLDPPDLAYATNVLSGGLNPTLQIVNLFSLDSGSLRATFGGGGAEKSLKLETPSLTLLPGSVLEQSIPSLPITLPLEGDAFRMFTGEARTVSFPGLPTLDLPLASIPLTLTPAGFSIASVPRAYGTNYAGLFSFVNQTSVGLSLEFTGTTLALRRSGGLFATVLGRTVSLSGGEARFEVTLGGNFAASFQVGETPSKNLGFNLLSFQPSGELSLQAQVNTPTPTFALSGFFSLHLAWPDPANPTNRITRQRDLGFNLEAGEAFAIDLVTDLPDFDLGWLRVTPGGDGRIAVSRDPATGNFSVGVNDWDLYVFGTKFDNQDFTVSSAGALSRSLPSTLFDLGSGFSLMRLVPNGVIPFTWNLETVTAASGRISLDLPSAAQLTFPNVTGLSGTLNSGLDLLSSFPTLTAAGTFDHTWSRSLTLNNLNFGTCTLEFRRTTPNGPVEFTASRDNALWTGLSLDVSANSGSATSFDGSLSGSFSVLGWQFGSANLDLNPGDAATPFSGTASITDPDGDSVASASLKIRGGARACVEFTFGGLFQQQCQP